MRFLIFSTLLIFSIKLLANEAIKHYENALNLLHEGKLSEAEIAVKNSLKDDLNYLPARLLLGKVLLKTGNLRSAEKEFEQAKKLHADSYAVTMSLVEVKLLLDKNEEVLALLNAQQQLKTDSQYFYFQGNAHKALLQYDLALLSYQQAIEMSNSKAQYHTALADLWYRKENTSNAQMSLNRALILDSNNIPALLLSSEIYKSLDQFEQAQQAISLIFSLENNHKQTLFAQASLFLAENKLPEALVITLTLRELAPYDPYARLLHSSIVAQQGHTKQARRILSEVKQQLSGVDNKYKNDQQVLLLSATVDFINQNSHSAKKQFIRYLDLYGENSSARRYLAIISIREQDLEKAQFHIEKALVKNSNEVELYTLASEIYRQAGLLTKQLKVLIKAKNNFPKNKKINEHYIASLLANNQQKKALATLNSNNGQSTLQNKTVLGFMQLQSGLFEQAHKTTQTLLKDHPGKVEVLQLAGELSLKTREDSKEAIYFFEQALVLDADFSPALLALSGIYLQQGRLAKVEEYYQQLLTANQSNTIALQLYADLAIKQGRFSLAIKLLEPLASNKNYQTGRALLNLYIATEQTAPALLLLNELEEEYPLNEALLLSRSRIKAQLGEQEPAKKALNILFGLLYDEPTKLILLASAQLELNDANSAAKTIARIKTLEQDPVPPMIQARLYIAQAKYQQAKKIIDKSLAPYNFRQIESRPWLSLKVSALIPQGHFKEATNIVENLYKQYQDREYLQLLAQLYSKQNRVDSLITILSHWHTNHLNDKWAVAQLSHLAFSQGNLDLAISSLERYPDLNNSPVLLNNLANYHLAQYLTKQGKLIAALNKDKAVEPALTIALNYVMKAYKIYPLNAEINDTLGWLYVQTGQTQKGLGLLREASARDGQNGEIYYHLAYALIKLKQNKQALSALEQAIELLPQHELRQLLSKRIVNG
jgi:putative PEP-CTERM system TPR-repeat lipoprotein